MDPLAHNMAIPDDKVEDILSLYYSHQQTRKLHYKLFGIDIHSNYLENYSKILWSAICRNKLEDRYRKDYE